MKIHLIYPYCLEQRYYEENINVPPIGLYYIGAMLRENGHDVQIINLYNLKDDPQTIRAILAEREADVIGFSVFNANRWGAIDVAEIAKEIHPKVKIVFGGVAATFLWQHFLTHFPQIDFVLLGEGELSFLQLLACIEQNRMDDLPNIKGIAFRQEDRIVKTDPPEPIRRLDELPIPSKYFTYQYVALTRGCPANCNFCGSPRFWGRRVRWHSADYFVKQLELLYRRGVSFFYFSDDTFTLKKEVVIEVCKKILERGLNINWYAISRVDTVDEEILYWMRKAGCIQISYGVESGSERIRKLLNKNISTGQIKKAFSLTTSYSILARAYFIYGCPGETPETIQETIDLIKEIKPLSVIFYVLRFFPGTALYSALTAKTQLNDDIWLQKIEDLLYFQFDPNLSEETVLRFGEDLRIGYYEALPSFVDAIELKEIEEFYPLYADFYSRLAMTFSHGDYSQIDAIPDKESIAATLYQKSLRFHPNQRAYLGLGILEQKKGNYRSSIKILEEGVRHFPKNEMLHMCLGISHMNMGEYRQAIAAFSKFPDSKEALSNIAICYRALGDIQNESIFLDRLHSLQEQK